MRRIDDEAKVDRLFTDRVYAIESLLRIDNKDRRAIPFLLRDYQKRLVRWIEHCEKQPGRYTLLCPKLRQGGFSLTGIAHAVLNARMKNGHRTLFLIKNGEDCEPFFDEVKSLEYSLPKDIQGEKERNQSRAIKYLDTKSSIRILEAGQSEATVNKKGRSAKVHLLWITEAEYIVYLASLLRGANNSVTPNGVTVLESTMNGRGSHFAELCENCRTNGKEVEKNVWVNGNTVMLFAPFYENPEYISKVPVNFKPENDKERKILELNGTPGNVMYRRVTITNSVKDNLSGLSPEQVFDYEYPTELDDGLSAAGRGYFDAGIMRSLSTVWDIKRTSVRFGIIKDNGKPKWVPANKYNDIEVYALPISGWTNRYMVFADCAEGLAKSDWDVTLVFDRVIGIVVAEHRAKVGAAIQSEIMMLLAWMYNMASLSWDRTGIGADRLPYLLREGYPNLLSTRDVINPLLEPDYLGIRWSADNKRQSCARLKYLIEDQIWKMPCASFYLEASKFLHGEKASKTPSAAVGSTDDVIMSAVGLAEMHYLLAMKPPKQEIKSNDFTVNNKLNQKLKRSLTPQSAGAYSGGGYE